MPVEEEEAVAQATEISIESVEEGNVQFQDEVSAVKQVLFQDQDDDSSSSDYGSHDKPGTVLQRLMPDGNVLFPDIFQTNQLLFYERFKAYQDYMLVLFQDQEDDSSSDYGSHGKPGTVLQRLMPDGNVLFPDIFQTNQLLFYERFKAYQDYMLGDCRTSEVKDFTAEYLEKVLEPSGWQAVWRTELFDVLIEVVDVEYLLLKADVELVTPCLCETKGCELTEESMKDLLEAKEHKVPVQELYVVYDESGEFDQIALAVEHVSYYDILEDRVPSGLVAEYHCLVSQCEEKYKEFTSLRNNISNSDSESELDNISMVEGLKMYDDLEGLKRKLKIIENPLLRYVLGYRVNSVLQSNRAKGPRPTGERMVHVVSSSMTGAGVEIYPGSTCSLVGNGIHHCKEGILIKDFTDEFYTMPKITMMNNVIHNNEGYGVILVKPADLPRMKKTTEADFQEVVGEILELPQTDYQKQMPVEEEEAVAQATEISIESVEEGNVQFQDEVSAVKQVLFQDQDDDSSSSDYGSHDKPGTVLQRLMPDGNVLFPDIFQTNQLLFYERFKAYQDYMLGDCRTSEVKDFTAEYLEKVLEPSGWQAVWRTEVFEVLIEVVDVEYLVLKAAVELVTPFLCETKGCELTEESMKDLLEAKEHKVVDVEYLLLKADVELVTPCLCETKGCELTEESMKDLLEAKEHKVPVQELYVVYDESGEFDQTALAVEHVSYYDILEDRVPSGLVAEYHCLVSQCEEKYKEFTSLRNNISNSDSESELDNISMVEGLKMYDDLEGLKRKLKIIENPLLRYVLGYRVNSVLQSNRAKGPRPTGERMVHVVSSSMTGAGVEIYPGSTCSLFGNGIHHCKEGILIKGAGVEIYPGSTCSLVGNGIHHCKEGILIKKSQLQKKKMIELGLTKADDDLMFQEMFVSINGNHFKRNGKGSFGSFFY
ncbi:UNVERIFIED_CONTAM: hypothetical protein FKN15_055585 [Acipenser sinensis]